MCVKSFNFSETIKNIENINKLLMFSILIITKNSWLQVTESL